MEATEKTIGFVFIDGFADWEYGLLSASAVEWFGARAVVLTPDRKPVRSSSGFSLAPDRDVDAKANEDLDAIAVVGSDQWMSSSAPDLSALLRSVRGRGGVVGGICAGTLALARTGLFADVIHTSNGRDWILKNASGYAGKDNYQDVPHAVAHRNVVSAPGSAPGTFALEFLRSLFPERDAEIAEMRSLFSKEYDGEARQPS